MVGEAAGKINGKLIKKNTITTKAIKDGTLSGADVADNGLTGADVADSSLTGADLANGSVPQAKLGPLAVTGAQVTDGSLSGADLAAGSVTADRLSQNAVFATVAANGTLKQGAGVVQIVRQGAGLYTLKFNAPITGRAVAATVHNESVGSAQINYAYCGGADPFGVGCGYAGFTTNNDILVNTEASDGTNADREFSVVVLPAVPGTSPAPATSASSGRTTGVQSGELAPH